VTLLQFEHWFRTEKACRDYLAKIRWPEGFCCPRCRHGQAWQTARGFWHCGKCRADVSVTTGTIFHHSHMGLRLWFRAIWWVTNQKSGVSALGLQRTLGLGSYRTAWICLHKLRRAMVRPGREPLAGTIEIDETFIGGHEKRGPGKGWRDLEKKAAVVVAAEAKEYGRIGRIRLKQVPDTSEESLIGFVKQMVAPGAAIVTDGWRGYNSLENHGFLRWRRPILTNERKAHELLPRVHRVASLLKRWLLGIHQGKISRKQLDYYLDEFVFRFNRRLSTDRGMLFYRLVQQAVAVDPAPYRKLIGQN
jgi:transposase-like protein